MGAQHDHHMFDRWCDQAFSTRKVKFGRYPSRAERDAALTAKRLAAQKLADQYAQEIAVQYAEALAILKDS